MEENLKRWMERRKRIEGEERGLGKRAEGG